MTQAPPRTTCWAFRAADGDIVIGTPTGQQFALDEDAARDLDSQLRTLFAYPGADLGQSRLGGARVAIGS